MGLSIRADYRGSGTNTPTDGSIFDDTIHVTMGVDHRWRNSGIRRFWGCGYGDFPQQIGRMIEKFGHDCQRVNIYPRAPGKDCTIFKIYSHTQIPQYLDSSKVFKHTILLDEDSLLLDDFERLQEGGVELSLT